MVKVVIRVKVNFVREKEIISKLFLEIPVVNNCYVTHTTDKGFISCIEMDYGYEFKIFVHVLKSSFPAEVRKLMDELYNVNSNYNMIIAPYISDETANICKKFNVGYIDMVGNCLIQYHSFYISVSGKKNKSSKRGLKSIFEKSSTVSSDILRYMLENVNHYWKMSDLAEEVGCSIGQVSKVKDFLNKNEWIEVNNNGFRINNPESVLKEWSSVYEKKASEVFECYSLDKPSILEKKLQNMKIDCAIDYYLTGFSGGVRYSPVVRYNKVHVYINSQDVKEAMQYLNCKQVDSGSNISIIIPYDECVLRYSRIINGDSVVSPVQIYLDSMQLKGRGEELAEAVLLREIRK